MDRYVFSARVTPAFWEFFSTNKWIFDMQIKVEEKGLRWSRWYELTEYIF